ncbi:MAG: Hpt domain-containing protein [Desulfobacterales bacterium]|nr:Hpt domain-containing protein [Desulfobacterales bacterium]
MNFKKLVENLGLNDDEFLEVMEIFIRTTASDLDRLQSAIVVGDTRQTAEAAHAIKGAAGNLGFNEIYEMAKALEEKARENSLEGAAKSAKTIRKKYEEIADKFR